MITTNINYAVSSGDPFVLEIRGNSYGNIVPLDLLYQGYIYSDTIINHGGISNGLAISGLVAINNGGNLCFWFPNQGYWNGYNVKVYTAYATRAVNRVTSITGVAKPTTAKEVALSANIRQSLHSGNYTSYSPSLTGLGASGTWAINITGNAATASNGGVTSVNGQTGAVTVSAGISTINYNNDSNSTYQMLWGSGNAIYGTGGIYCNPSTDNLYATAFQATSDETLKTNWTNLPEDYIYNLVNVKYGTYDRVDIQIRQDGVSAQSLQKVLPNSVNTGENGKLTVNYGNAALVSVIKLTEKVIELEDRIKQLEQIIKTVGK